MTGMEQLGAWLVGGSSIEDRSVEAIDRWPLVGWRCKLYDGVNKFRGFGPTPDAAAAAAVEAVRKGQS